MKIENGEIKIDIEELVNKDEFLVEFAKHASFNKNLFNGIVQLLLTDEVQWDKDKSPWYTIVSFGRSYFEEARKLLISKADEAAQKQVEIYKKERDTIEEYYRKYLSKNVELENRVSELEYELRMKGN